MKRSIILAACLLGVGGISAQKIKEAELPPSVKNAFKQKFPNAKVEKWEKENGNYELVQMII